MLSATKTLSGKPYACLAVIGFMAGFGAAVNLDAGTAPLRVTVGFFVALALAAAVQVTVFKISLAALKKPAALVRSRGAFKFAAVLSFVTILAAAMMSVPLLAYLIGSLVHQ